jgi:transcription initiation factor TFIIE subunit alpha
MKEDDICELLKFERKMLRARISTLRNDKFIQVRLKMETGLDGKAQKVNYYFINYKVRKHIIDREVFLRDCYQISNFIGDIVTKII